MNVREREKDRERKKLSRMKNYPQERKNSNAPQSAPSMAFEAGNKVNANRENGSPTKQQPTNKLYTEKCVARSIHSGA